MILSTTLQVVDNWVFDTAGVMTHGGDWRRIADTPVMNGNFHAAASVYRDRWVILPGGEGYDNEPIMAQVVPDVWANEKYKPPAADDRARRHHPVARGNMKHRYSNGVLVYDIRNDSFHWSDSMPINNNGPLTYIHDDYIYVIAGETGTGCAFGKAYGQWRMWRCVYECTYAGPSCPPEPSCAAPFACSASVATR